MWAAQRATTLAAALRDAKEGQGTNYVEMIKRMAAQGREPPGYGVRLSLPVRNCGLGKPTSAVASGVDQHGHIVLRGGAGRFRYR